MNIALIQDISSQGVSRPYRCIDERGGLRWCKGNHTGLRSLIAEWMSACIARRLELPVPDFTILRLDCGYFELWAQRRAEAIPRIVVPSNCHVFGSLNVENSKDVLDASRELVHVDQVLLGRIYAFDRLIHNTDRTDYNSNLLVNGSVYIIDHNNAFDPAFDVDVFAREHILRKHYANLDADLHRRFCAFARERITPQFLSEVWSEMPEEWTDVGGDLLSLEKIAQTVMGEVNGR